jgi:KDO2-lipid IV(A) lauroyltransferase
VKYKPQHVVEYALLRSTAWLLNILSYRAALCLVWVIAAVSSLFLRSKMRRTRVRLRQVFKNRFTERELAGIAWRAWRNFCFNAVEMFRVPSINADWVKRVADFGDIHIVLDNMKDGKGAVLAVPHMGNWEFAGVGAQLLGMKIMSIVRRQRNPLLDAYLNRMREYTGVEAFLREAHSFAGIARGLKAGKVLAILPDLRAKADFVPVHFLGTTAQIPAGMAAFARQSGVPIIPAFAIRVGWARHLAKGFEPIWPDPTLDEREDWKRMTQYVMDCFDHAIREYPDQYFWFNGRWVLGEEFGNLKPET